MWKIISWVTGGIFDKVFGAFLDYRNQKSVIEADLLTETIHADIEINRMKLAARKLDAERWETRWLMPSFAYPTAVWWNLVILDSIFHFDWNISALPKPLDEWAGQIILSFFIVGTTQSLIKSFMNRGIVATAIENVKSVVTGIKGRRIGRDK